MNDTEHWGRCKLCHSNSYMDCRLMVWLVDELGKLQVVVERYLEQIASQVVMNWHLVHVVVKLILVLCFPVEGGMN